MSRWTNSQVANADVALARLIASHSEHIRDAAEQWEKPHIVGNLGPCASYVPLRHLSKLLICLAGVEGLEPPTPGFGDRCSSH